MIFGLKYVPNHGVYRLHEAFDHFIRTGCDQKSFGAACFPGWFAPVFQDCPKLRTLSKKLWRSFRTSAQDLSRVRSIWNGLGNVEAICCDDTLTLDFDQPTKATKNAISGLFRYLYVECLGVDCCKHHCGDIDDHYAQFRKECSTVCPFCGLETYPDPECGYRAAYDHYLCKRSYPLLAVSFRNLVPICDSCNKAPQKHDTDMLRCENGTRRKAYYPFGRVGGARVSVSWTEKPTLGNQGKCEIKVAPKNPAESGQITTWIAVYRILQRGAARIQSRYDTWLKEVLRHRGFATKPTIAELRAFFRDEAQVLIEETTLRQETNALYKHGVCAYLADTASDAELEGIACIATSRVVHTPIAVDLRCCRFRGQSNSLFSPVGILM